MNSPHPSRSIGTLACQRIDHVFDAAFGPAGNPLRHLGALGFLFLWLIVASGLYLYAAFDTSVTGAYRSVAWLSHEQWYLGGVLRSLHRYAADAFIAVTLLHLLREFLLGRYSGFRRYSWLTGVPLLWFAYASGIVGFWLGWDRLAQFSALATAEWLDRLPLVATPLTRNFMSNAAVSDRLFSLFIFVHIGVPLLLLFGLWFHIRRISRAEVFPEPALAAGALVALLALALVLPVTSQGPADLSRAPGLLALDWLYLFIHPLMYAGSPGALWALVLGATLFLLALPALPRPAAPSAVVHPDACSGCRRCADDCPYAAIAMVPHPDRPGRELARVDADLCAGCGICTGSCPSSTPFRSGRALVTGIDMPQLPLAQLRRSLDEKLAATSGDGSIVLFGCDCGPRVDSLAGADVASLSLICTGMLPPSFVEYALRIGAEGVLVSGCRAGGCAFRLGNRWTEERLHGAREPQLRAGVERDRLRLAWADRGEENALARALAEFRTTLAAAAAAAPLRRISVRD